MKIIRLIRNIAVKGTTRCGSELDTITTHQRAQEHGERAIPLKRKMWEFTIASTFLRPILPERILQNMHGSRQIMHSTAMAQQSMILYTTRPDSDQISIVTDNLASKST